MKYLLYVLFFSISSHVFAECDSCLQYKKAIEYLKDDSDFKSYYKGVRKTLRINNKIKHANFIFTINFPYEYIAYKLGFKNKEDLFNNEKDSIIYSMQDELEIKDKSDTLFYQSICLQKLTSKRNQKIDVEIYRVDENVIVVNTSRIYKNKNRFSYGINYLFFFSKEYKIEKTYNEAWIE